MLVAGTVAGIRSPPNRRGHTVTDSLRSRAAIATLAGLGVAGLLAGCSTAAADPSTGSSGTASSSGSSTTASKSTDTYKDGTYTEQGMYNSPGGQELISVELTIANNAVSAVTVKTVKADPTATQYEQLFEGGISKAVVGKKINDLNVSRVGGSSLTSQGFNDALTKIKADAKA
jgi:hypothetical protein